MFGFIDTSTTRERESKRGRGEREEEEKEEEAEEEEKKREEEEEVGERVEGGDIAREERGEEEREGGERVGEGVEIEREERTTEDVEAIEAGERIRKEIDGRREREVTDVRSIYLRCPHGSGLTTLLHLLGSRLQSYGRSDSSSSNSSDSSSSSSSSSSNCNSNSNSNTNTNTNTNTNISNTSNSNNTNNNIRVYLCTSSYDMRKQEGRLRAAIDRNNADSCFTVIMVDNIYRGTRLDDCLWKYLLTPSNGNSSSSSNSNSSSSNNNNRHRYSSNSNSNNSSNSNSNSSSGDNSRVRVVVAGVAMNPIYLSLFPVRLDANSLFINRDIDYCSEIIEFFKTYLQAKRKISSELLADRICNYVWSLTGGHTYPFLIFCDTIINDPMLGANANHVEAYMSRHISYEVRRENIDSLYRCGYREIDFTMMHDCMRGGEEGKQRLIDAGFWDFETNYLTSNLVMSYYLNVWLKERGNGVGSVKRSGISSNSGVINSSSIINSSSGSSHNEHVLSFSPTYY